jgi:putative salt-induced outer membrane protein YdiY
MSFLLALLSTAPLFANDVQAAPAPQAPAAPAVVEPKWTGSVALGATYADGNTDRRTASATAAAEYRREKDRITIGFLWSYAEEKLGITDRKTQGRIKYDYFFTKKFYGLAQASAENDFASGLELRTTVGAGAGYQFQDKPSWKVSGELGLSYVDENFNGTVDDNNFLAARAAYAWDWKPNDKYALSQVGEIFPSLENSDDVNARVDTKARMNLSAKMFAQIEWLYQWDNTPPAGNSRNDTLILLALGWSF